MNRDETALVIPDSWRERLYPRRGGVPVSEIKIKDLAPARVRRRVQTIRPFLETVLDHEGSERELVRRARDHLSGEANPLGAAVLRKIDSKATQPCLPLEKWVDAWVVEHGLAFAACAFAELGGITVDLDLRRKDFPHLVRHSGWHGVVGASAGRRLRALLAAANERDYAEAVGRLADHRRTPLQRIVVSFLVPTRQDWVAECCAEPPRRAQYSETHDATMLWCALGSAEQLARLGGWARLARGEHSLELLATVAEGVGPAIAPVLAGAFDEGLSEGTGQVLLEVLGALPGDEAFRLMATRLDKAYVLPAMRAMARRFPVRALRVLPSVAASGSKSAVLAKELLTRHLLDEPELTAAVVPRLPDVARTVIEAVQRARVADASADALPRLLVEPPWTQKRKAHKPLVMPGDPAGVERALRWTPGEREEWARADGRGYVASADRSELERDLAAFQKRPSNQYVAFKLFNHGPEDLVRPLLADWRPRSWWFAVEWMKALVARYELEALPHALEAARTQPASQGSVLLPFLDAEVAALMAGWLARLKSARTIAIAWFDRHGVDAARLLFPAALGKLSKERRQAEGALRLIAAKAGAERIVAAAAAAAANGEAAAGAIEALLATDPLDILPARPPKAADWLEPGLMPQVLLRGGDLALPVAATEHVITTLAMSKPGEAYAGVEVVRELCDPESLAEFAWVVFLQWRAHGAPAKDGWALTQLGLLGDDETVRRLTPVIRAWPGEGGHKKAVDGLEVLAAIGTDVALTHRTASRRR
ncbi:hypothetical protein [Actinomadura alba]|uniref:DUF4132 domain-containing protein n=1 Tax=Actinomadura alba TaxID=406431 RepID=A0ABR7LSI1_9ACTN|nr:hypothetical protein [Actinomadura alba]MBC6467797.1 hypothetical protein [Actinomadura alba]